MSSVHMSVRLYLCGLRVLEVSVDAPTRLEVVVELSAAGGGCGARTAGSGVAVCTIGGRRGFAICRCRVGV